MDSKGELSNSQMSSSMFQYDIVYYDLINGYDIMYYDLINEYDIMYYDVNT